MTLPTLFVSHGPPTLIIEDVPSAEFLRGLGATLEAPEAVLCVSAHWETADPAVSAVAAPETIYDFYGFPDPLYRLRYAAPGAPELARRTAALLDDAGIGCALDDARGLDHGAWAPLMMMYPDADIPVTQLSIQRHGDAAHHLALGRAIAALRDDGVLVLASGNATHNLSERAPPGAPPFPWVRAFDDWLVGRVEAGDDAALVDYLAQGPDAARNHPSADHYVPLLVAMGAAGAGARGRRLHTSFLDAALAMTAFEFS